MSLVEKCWMVTSKISVIALLMITGIYFGKFVCPYIKKKKGAVAVSIVYITIMLVLYMIPPQIDNFSAYLPVTNLFLSLQMYFLYQPPYHP
jgi:two-component system, LytTR family, sensor histidine kinase AgrC